MKSLFAVQTEVRPLNIRITKCGKKWLKSKLWYVDWKMKALCFEKDVFSNKLYKSLKHVQYKDQHLQKTLIMLESIKTFIKKEPLLYLSKN